MKSLIKRYAETLPFLTFAVMILISVTARTQISGLEFAYYVISLIALSCPLNLIIGDTNRLYAVFYITSVAWGIYMSDSKLATIAVATSTTLLAFLILLVTSTLEALDELKKEIRKKNADAGENNIQMNNLGTNGPEFSITRENERNEINNRETKTPLGGEDYSTEEGTSDISAGSDSE